jgi:hypothetical protein
MSNRLILMKTSVTRGEQRAQIVHVLMGNLVGEMVATTLYDWLP